MVLIIVSLVNATDVEKKRIFCSIHSDLLHHAQFFQRTKLSKKLTSNI